MFRLVPVAVLTFATLMGPATHTAPPASIDWTACPEPAAAQYHAQCGTLTVPVDWSDPGGASISLALLRVPATGTATGTVLADSEDLAGYGGSQIEFFLNNGQNFLSRLPATHATKDIVTFDPRGMGLSAGVHCSVAGHDPQAVTLAELLAHNRAVAAGCHSTPPNLIDHMGLLDQARDVDAIRAALGMPSLNWFGQATGSALGAVYASLYPDRVGTMVLDAPVDPTESAAARAWQAGQAEEGAFDAFASWCAQKGPSVCALAGQNVGDVLDQVVALADAGQVSGAPILPRPLTGAEVRITVGQWLLAYPIAWSALAGAILSASHGDGSGLAAFTALTYTDPDYTVSRLQSCADSPMPAALLPSLRDQLARTAPYTAGDSLALDVAAGCVGWPRDHAPLVLPARVRPASTVLVTATTGDPITPYAWAVSVAHRLVGSRLLTATVYGHAGFDNSVCAGAAIDTYLSSDVLPTQTTCAD